MTSKRFPNLFLTVAAVVVFTAAASPADAQRLRKADVLGAKVALPVPPGYCPLRLREPADKQAIEIIERVHAGRNTMLLMFANCLELEAYRRDGTPLKNYGTYLAPDSATEPVKVSRAVFSGIMAKQFEEQKASIEQAQENAKNQHNAEGKGASLAESDILGVVHKDASAAYHGVVQNWQTEGSEKLRVSMIAALTVVRERVISINLQGPHRGKKSLRKLLRRQKRNIKRLVSANRG